MNVEGIIETVNGFFVTTSVLGVIQRSSKYLIDKEKKHKDTKI